jgi:hypothetical protein
MPYDLSLPPSIYSYLIELLALHTPKPYQVLEIHMPRGTETIARMHGARKLRIILRSDFPEYSAEPLG